MSAGLLFDTDVLIDYLRGQPQAVRFLENASGRTCMSAISIGELYAGVREGRERLALKAFLAAFEVVSIDASIAEQGGLICRDYRKSHGVGLADALIAATAELNGLELVTLNRKHFPMLKSVVVPSFNAQR